MALELRVYPDAVLRETSAPVETIDAYLRELARGMTRMLYTHNAVGLAAPQVGVNLRLIVMDASEKRNAPQAYVNPEIESPAGREGLDEGCLSLPELRAPLERAARVHVYAQNLDGEDLEFDAEGLAARAFQHEIDHLDGILFIDRLSPVDRFQIREEIKRLEQTFARSHAHPSGSG